MLRWHRFELISLRFGRYGLWRDCCWASGPIVYLYYRYLLMIGVLDFLLQPFRLLYSYHHLDYITLLGPLPDVCTQDGNLP